MTRYGGQPVHTYRLIHWIAETVCWLAGGHRYQSLTGAPSLQQCRWCDRSRTLVRARRDP